MNIYKKTQFTLLAFFACVIVFNFLRIVFAYSLAGAY